jgi:hypothetical protein
MRLDWKILGCATGSFLAITYLLCVVFDLATGSTMYTAWVALLPGFTWISWGSFALGLIESFGYGIYFGLVFAPLYNFFLVKVWKQAR